MKIILPMIPDPADIVIQGFSIGDMPIEAPYNPIVSMLDPVLQGAVIGNYEMKGFPVPRAMIGWLEDFGTPAQTGPKVLSGGELVMLDIGAGKPQRVFVDKTQEWLMSAIQKDLTGAMIDKPDGTLGAEESVDDFFVTGIAWFEERPAMMVPRRAIRDSGIIKNMTASKVSKDFSFRCPDRFVDTTEPIFVYVTVLDELSVAVQGATVYLMQDNLMIVGNAPTVSPINQIGITDASGQCSFTISYFIFQKLLAYKEGATPKSGLSLTTQGNASITLYIKDPTIAGGIGGGGATCFAY